MQFRAQCIPGRNLATSLRTAFFIELSTRHLVSSAIQRVRHVEEHGWATVKQRSLRNEVKATRHHARRRAAELPEIERFESLLDDLSATLAQATSNDVDTQIETWLGRICLALNLDRSAIYERDTPGEMVRTSHTWIRSGIPPFPRRFDPERLVKTSTDWIMAGNQLVFSNPSEIPPALSDVRRFVVRYGPKASALFPMWAGNRVIGAASFGKFRSHREWPSRLLEQLKLAVRIFAGAIERKQAEAAVDAARAELALAQRRSMMGEMVASLAHEVNQPLGAILSNLGGIARLLSQGNPDPALATKAVSNAIEDTKRAADVVRRIRGLFRGDTTHKVAVDAGALVNEVSALIASEAAAREVRVKIEPPRTKTRVIGDRVLLQQCILNLLMNAFEAVVTVDRDRRQVTTKINPARDGWIAISVIDNGPGIHPSIAGRLFEPFVTTKSHGMGLGLLVTRSIMEDHGGKIESCSGDAGGTTFTLTLPAARTRRPALGDRTAKPE